MIDQSFSAENFRKIYEQENRKGINLDLFFSREYMELKTKIKDLNDLTKELRKTKKYYSKTTYNELFKDISDEKEKEKQLKDDLLLKELNIFSNDIKSKKIEIDLKESEISGKKIYTIKKLPATYFAMKQTQYNIKSLYDVHPSSRNVIVSQLKALLNNSYPKIIIKSDIKSFYENISTQSLLSTLNSNSLLSLTSKKIIKQILKKFQDESGVTKGIPRGIGLSAYLSEIYLKDFDEKIKSHPEIIYYERYVDDIIAVFTPNSINQVIDYKEIYKEFIIKELEKINLPVNNEKTIPYDLINGRNKSISYLGYEFKISNAPVKLSPTGNRIAKYKYRIEKTFDSYLKDMKRNEKKARKKFIMRLKFLTGNTKLKKNKKNALIGVYFSNCFATDLSKIYSLDDFLNNQKTKITNPLILEKISKFTFKKGFDEKTFYNFTQTDFNEIVAAWKQ